METQRGGSGFHIRKESEKGEGRPHNPGGRSPLGGEVRPVRSGYAVSSWPVGWKKETASSSLRINSRPKEPEPQLLAMAEDAFCR